MSELPPPGPPHLVYDGPGWGIERKRREAREAWEREHGSDTIAQRTHEGDRMNPTDRVHQTISRAALLGAIAGIAHAIAGIHLESINTYEGVAVAAVSILLAGMTGYGGQLAALAAQARDAAKQIGGSDA